METRGNLVMKIVNLENTLKTTRESLVDILQCTGQSCLDGQTKAGGVKIDYDFRIIAARALKRIED